MNRTTKTHQGQQSHQEQKVPQSPETASGCLLRVYWMLLGNALVAVAAYKIAQAENAFALVDLVYWLIVSTLIGARYVDIRILHGRTGEGQPATMEHWKRYSLKVVGMSVFLWFVAHGLSYFAG